MSAQQTVARLQARLGLNRQEFSSGLRGARVEADQFGRTLQSSFSRLRGVLGLVGVGLSGAAITRGIRSAVSDLSALGKAARDAAMDVEELQGLQRGFARNARVSTEEVTRAFVDFNTRVGQAVSGQGELARIVDRYGISLRSSNGQMRSQSELLREIAERIRNARSESERAAIAQGAFGEVGRRMAQALAGGSDALNEMVDQAQAAGDVIERNLIHRAELLDDKFDQLTRNAQTYFQRISVGLLAGGAATAIDTLEQLFGSLERARSILGDNIFENTIAETGELTAQVVEDLSEIATAYVGLQNALQDAKPDLDLFVLELSQMGEIGAAEVLSRLIAESEALQDSFAAATISGADFREESERIAARINAVITQFANMDGVSLDGVTGRVNTLTAALARAAIAASEVAAELPGAVQPGVIARGRSRLQSAVGDQVNQQRFASEEARRAARTREQIALERELEQVQRRARDDGVNLTREQAEAQARLNLELAAAANPDRNRAGGGGQARPDEFARAVTSIREQTQALELEAAALIAVAASGQEYGDAIEYARRQAELLLAAQRAGMEITPQLEAEVSALAQAYVTAGMNAQQAADHMEQIRQSSERWAQNMAGHFDGLITSGKGLSGVLASIARQLESSGWQMLFSGLSGGGKGSGGFLSGLIGLFTGGAIPKYATGTSYHPGGLARINELGGEIVNLPTGAQVIPHDLSKEMARGQGGVQRVELILSPDLEARILEQSGQNAVLITREGMKQLDRQLPARMQQINRDPRRRG